MAKFIEISFSYDQGLQKNCVRSGEIMIAKKLISIDKISFIKSWEGELLHKGRTGVEIHTVDGRKHIDERSYEVFSILLDKVLNSKH